MSIQSVAGLHGSPASEGRRKPLERVQSSQPTVGQVGDKFLEAMARIESGVRIGHGVQHNRAAAKALHLISHCGEVLTVLFNRVQLAGFQINGDREKESLRNPTCTAQLGDGAFVEHPLVRRVLIDYRQTLRRLEHNIGVEYLQVITMTAQWCPTRPLDTQCQFL